VVAARWERLAAAVPRRCPWHGCGLKRVRTVSGGHDRAAVVEATFACERVITIPNAARASA
jgi:hypothetical protein